MTETEQQARTTGTRERPAQSPLGSPPARGPRSARLVVRRIEPWSVLRFSAMLAIAFVVVVLVAVAGLYALLNAMGVFDTVGKFTTEIGASGSAKLITFGTLLKWTVVVSVGLAVLGAAAATIATFVYNVVNDLAGGPEITLTERN